MWLSQSVVQWVLSRWQTWAACRLGYCTTAVETHLVHQDTQALLLDSGWAVAQWVWNWDWSTSKIVPNKPGWHRPVSQGGSCWANSILTFSTTDPKSFIFPLSYNWQKNQKKKSMSWESGIRTLDLCICRRMLYHWAIPPLGLHWDALHLSPCLMQCFIQYNCTPYCSHIYLLIEM